MKSVRIITETDPAKFAEVLTQELQEGWSLQGNMTVHTCREETDGQGGLWIIPVYSQLLVRG